jgi:hypothetical protein
MEQEHPKNTMVSRLEPIFVGENRGISYLFRCVAYGQGSLSQHGKSSASEPGASHLVVDGSTDRRNEEKAGGRACDAISVWKMLSGTAKPGH